jgi:hypothetical protein
MYIVNNILKYFNKHFLVNAIYVSVFQERIDFAALQTEYYTTKMVPQCNRMLKYNVRSWIRALTHTEDMENSKKILII